MHGKAVKIRHCPATVSGTSSRVFVTAWQCACGKASATEAPQSQETGSAETWELFSEGEKIMSTLSLLFFLLLSPSALHQRSGAVIFHGCALSRLGFADRPYSLEFETVGALYERPRCIFCAKPSPSEQF